MPDGSPTAGGSTITLIERALVLLMIALLLLGVFEVLRPFITAILFGAIVAVAAWPLREALVQHGVRRGWAATLMLLLSLVVLAIPAVVLAPGLAEQVMYGGERVARYMAAFPASPPDWVAGLPLVGDQIANVWADIASGEVTIAAVLEPYSAGLRSAFVAAAGGLADSLLQLALALIIATMFWVHGRELAVEVRDVLRRLGGEHAAAAVDTVGASVRSVAYGVVGTSVVEGVMMGSGLGVSGIPGAATLGFVTFLLAVSQIGLPLMYALGLGSAWYLFHIGAIGWAAFMVVWTGVISVFDHILRPLLISYSGRMPLTLVILGVFGGFVSFGFLGLFIGPSLLAVAFTLLSAWRRRAA